jgi:diketogulonate reductase-like aldo/keto reductase
MEAQIDAGRTKAIGLSNFNITQIKRILQAARIPPANLQVELHVFCQQHELVEFCKEHNILVCAYSPLGSRGTENIYKAVGIRY